jgi:hypothetical protein
MKQLKVHDYQYTDKRFPGVKLRAYATIFINVELTEVDAYQLGAGLLNELWMEWVEKADLLMQDPPK